jgi:hypothetical protein
MGTIIPILMGEPLAAAAPLELLDVDVELELLDVGELEHALTASVPTARTASSAFVELDLREQIL